MSTPAREAGALLGVQEVIQLGHHDGTLEAHRAEATEAVARAVRATRPEIVIGHDPCRLYEPHPDHRAAGWATVDAMIVAREHHAPRTAPSTVPARCGSQARPGPTSSPTSPGSSSASSGRWPRTRASSATSRAWRDRVRAWNASIGAERGAALAEAFRVMVLPGAPI